MEGIIWLIVGLVFGAIMMCLLQGSRYNTYINIIKILIEDIDHERVCAVHEKRSDEYLNGMSRIFILVKTFFKEELDNERLKKKN